MRSERVVATACRSCNAGCSGSSTAAPIRWCFLIGAQMRRRFERSGTQLCEKVSCVYIPSNTYPTSSNSAPNTGAESTNDLATGRADAAATSSYSVTGNLVLWTANAASRGCSGPSNFSAAASSSGCYGLASPTSNSCGIRRASAKSYRG